MKTSQLDEGQSNRTRPYAMDRELPVGNNGGDDNQGQCHGKTPSGGKSPARLTCVIDPRCDLHLRTNQVSRRVCIKGLGAMLCRESRLGGDRK